MRKVRFPTAALGLAMASLLGAAAADAQPVAHPASRCFLSREWNGWKATPDARAIHIRVGVNRFYRLDLAGSCPMLNAPMAHLVTIQRGTSWICSGLDMNLKVSNGHGFVSPCPVRTITPLTHDEAAALPRGQKP